MIAELLSKVTNRRRERSAQAVAPYSDVCRRLAADETIDVEAIEIALQSAGKSENELAADVALIKKRLAWAEQVARRDAAQREHNAAQAENDRLQGEFNQLKLDYQRKFDAIRETKIRCDQELAWAFSAQADLVRTCMDAELLDRERELSERLRGLADRQRDLQDQLNPSTRNTATAAIVVANRNLAAFSKPGTDAKAKERYQFEVDALQAKIDAQNAELATIDKQIRELNRELAVLAKQKLIP